MKGLKGMKNLTPKGNLRDGCYYPITCPRCGKHNDGGYIRPGNVLACTICCNDEGVKLR